jgi:hypothetical protein
MTLELLVRPFVSIDSTPKPREPSIPPVVDPQAFIRWGAKSTFTTNDFREESQGMGFGVDDEGPPDRLRHVYSEEGRDWRDSRVENPSDPDQYVIVRDTLRIAFRGPDGAQFTFNLSPQLPGEEEGEGQEPPAPPTLDQIP